MQRSVLYLCMASALAAPIAADAGPFDAMYVFGDSLSDRGNLGEYFGGFPNPPSFHQSFTNGPTAVNVLAQSMGLKADPSLWLNNFQDVNNLFGGASYVPGANYAVGGATAQYAAANGISDAINLPQQVGAYETHVNGVADPDALYTVFIGGNDVIDSIKPGGGLDVAVGKAVTSEVDEITSLEAIGAKHFLVVNVADVGETPMFVNTPDAAEATKLSLEYDVGLASALLSLHQVSGVILQQFNLYNYAQDVLDNASRFGITDTVDPCYDGATPFSARTSSECGSGARNIGSLAFWDEIHPTAKVHAVWARGFEEALAGDPNPSPVPEPATWSLMIIGSAALGSALRRTRRLPGARLATAEDESRNSNPL